MATTSTEKAKRVQKGLYTYRRFEIRYNAFDPSGAAHVRPRAGHKFWHVFRNGTNRAECYTIKDATWQIDSIIKAAAKRLVSLSALAQTADTTEEYLKWSAQLDQLRADFPDLVVDEAAVIAKIQEYESREDLWRHR